MTPSEAPTRIGAYLLLRRLGKGASSDVFEARDTRSGVHRALKLFTGPRPGDGFVREARVALELRHPNLCSAHDMGYLASGARYVAFDLAGGGTLRSRLTGRRPPLSFVRHVVVELGRALGVLHGLGLVHRDLKPENVLIAGPELHARVLLGDLGTCATYRHGPARGDLGSPAYMAPEQIEGECDTRADLYSFAVIAYEMLAGTRPFVGSPREVLEAHLKTEPSFARLPLAVAAVLRRALAKAPDQRFADIGRLVIALDRALAQEMILGASAPSPSAVDTPVLARDPASGWSVERASAAGVAVRGAERSDLLALPLDREGTASVAASGVVRAALRDGAATTLVSDGEPVRVASALYGLPPLVAVRRLAGDAVTVEGGSSPSIVRLDARGGRLATAALPVPVSSLVVVAMDDGEHVLGIDLQRKRLVAQHSSAAGARARVLEASATMVSIGEENGRVRVAFESGASAEVCVDSDGAFHMLGWSSR